MSYIKVQFTWWVDKALEREVVVHHGLWFLPQGEILLRSNVRNKLLTPTEYYQTLAYLAHAYYLDGDYELAEGIFRQALAARRLLERNDLPGNLPAICDENELKFKTAQCLAQLHHTQEAVAIIESIPTKQRLSKVQYLYAQLQKDRTSNAAIVALKEVLKEHQLALDVAEQLLDLGVHGLEVNSLVVDATHMPQSTWLVNWIEAHSFLSAFNYKAAVNAFKQMMNESPIQNHHRMLVQIGKCYFYDGSYDLATRYLERAHAESPQMCDEGLILLANLYCRENRLADLERLTAATANVNEYRHEHWFILALCRYYADRFERVDYFLDKARGKSTFLDIEVSLLKATVNISFQKYDQALMELRGIMKVAEHRFGLYQKFVEIYMKRGKTKDAEFYANMARQALGKTPRTLMLLAKTQDTNPAVYPQYKALLLRIHKMDENYLPAIDTLVDLLVKESDYLEAGRILRQQLAVQPNTRMATRMGDICTVLGEHSNALSFYNMAVRLDPSNQKAINALNNMSVDGRRGGSGGGSSSSAGGGGVDAGMRNCSTTATNNLSCSATGDVPFDVVDYGGDVSGVTSHTDQSSSLVQNETLWDDAQEMNNN